MDKKYDSFLIGFENLLENDEIVNIGVLGISARDKLAMVSRALSNSGYKSGILMNQSLRNLAARDALGVNVYEGEHVQIEGLELIVHSYSKNSFKDYANDKQALILFPVETSLSVKSERESLQRVLESSHAAKNILITNNDYYSETIQNLDSMTDDTVLLDSSSKYPDIVNNILGNIGAFPYPYPNETK